MKPWPKIVAFRALSLLPGGAGLYRFAQRHLTRSIVPTRERVRSKVEVGLQHWDWLERHGRAAGVRTMIDFGAGWHPSIPLLLHALGVEELHLLDIQPAIDRECLAGTIALFREIAPELPRKVRRLPEPAAPGEDLHAIFRRLGMHYHAPYQALPGALAGKADLIFSTQVLLHLDRELLRHSFRGLHATLKPGGIFMATIHLRDLFGGLNGPVSPYFSLQFSPATWERAINSPMMGFNRLKAPDYRALLEEAGFKLLAFEVDPVGERDLAELAKVNVHPCFAAYSREELAARHLFFAAERPA